MKKDFIDTFIEAMTESTKDGKLNEATLSMWDKMVSEVFFEDAQQMAGLGKLIELLCDGEIDRATFDTLSSPIYRGEQLDLGEIYPLEKTEADDLVAANERLEGKMKILDAALEEIMLIMPELMMGGE